MPDTLDEWLNAIEQINSQEVELGLDRINTVLQQLKLDFSDKILITVAGTNGKGSCIAGLTAILMAAGYRIGVYTSPHLLRFNERISINNAPIDDASLVSNFNTVESLRNNIPLTFFEFTTLTALNYFNNQQLDVVILEVGLGGRLDAVNCVDPDIAVITSIDIDHTEYLGDTREKIGAEKAGIFRQKAIAVCGDPNPPFSVIEKAQSTSKAFYCAGSDFTFESMETAWHWKNVSGSALTELPKSSLALPALSTALQVCYLLNSNSLAITDTHIEHGLKNVRLPGRFQTVHMHPRVIIDVAHNPHATSHLAQKLKENCPHGKIMAVCGFLEDKDISGMIDSLTVVIEHWYLGTLSVSRGASVEVISRIAYDKKIKYTNYHAITDAYEAALRDARPEDTVIVFGSFHTVETVMRITQSKESVVNHER